MVEAEEKTDSKSLPSSDEISGIVYKGKVRDLLVEDGKKIRVAGDAKEKFFEYFDNVVKQGAEVLLKSMPRISRGDNKGKLKGITITTDILDSLINPNAEENE